MFEAKIARLGPATAPDGGRMSVGVTNATATATTDSISAP